MAIYLGIETLSCYHIVKQMTEFLPSDISAKFSIK